MEKRLLSHLMQVILRIWEVVSTHRMFLYIKFHRVLQILSPKILKTEKLREVLRRPFLKMGNPLHFILTIIVWWKMTTTNCGIFFFGKTEMSKEFRFPIQEWKETKATKVRVGLYIHRFQGMEKKWFLRQLPPL